MAWRCRFLAARRSQHGRVIVEKCAPDTLVDFHTGEHHNVQTTRAYDCDCENPNPTVAAIVGGAWEWMSGFRGWCAGDQGSFSRHWELIYGDEETPEGAAHSYATYILGISMGILTNIVLELVLVCRVHLLGGVPGGPSPRTLKVLRYAVWCQLLPLAVFIPVNYWAQYDLAKRFLRSHDQGNAYGKAIYASASGPVWKSTSVPRCDDAAVLAQRAVKF